MKLNSIPFLIYTFCLASASIFSSCKSNNLKINKVCLIIPDNIKIHKASKCGERASITNFSANFWELHFNKSCEGLVKIELDETNIENSAINLPYSPAGFHTDHIELKKMTDSTYSAKRISIDLSDGKNCFES